MTIDGALNTNNLLITLGCGFTLINIAYSFLILKWTAVFSNSQCRFFGYILGDRLSNKKNLHNSIKTIK